MPLLQNTALNIADKLPNSELERAFLIETALQSVYTVYSEFHQGSAFLYDEFGHVVTNAHVVEGSFQVTVTSKDGKEYEGKVIGYSNVTDVALIHVPELVGQIPFPIEKEASAHIGEEVIALGSPLGIENTATVGYLTGKDRNFNIPPHTFENVYQISAQLEPGNSGGPLLSISDKKFIAINSAKHLDAEKVAFSIPIYQVVSLIEEWIKHPLSENELANLFYDDSGNLYYQWLWTLYEEFYFDGGTFTEDEDYHDWYYDNFYDYYDSDYDFNLEKYYLELYESDDSDDDHSTDDWDYEDEYYDDHHLDFEDDEYDGRDSDEWEYDDYDADFLEDDDYYWEYDDDDVDDFESYDIEESYDWESDNDYFPENNFYEE